jgi:acetyl-CoA carboxylase biotin carboxylase subunit
VAVFSEADRTALHVRLADEARPIGPAPSRESYLRIDRVLEAARASGSDAIHPGYGFLAENADFARACEDAGIAFIGPRSGTIALMGEKTSARREAVAAGVPVVPGTLEPILDETLLAREAERIGYPVMLKAAAGGGGKGLRFVAAPADLLPSLARARSEARGAFGDESVYLEKAIGRPRHVEIQVLADHHGHAVHLFERECSIQRRHQKVIEESPSPLLTPALRERMGALAVALVRRVGYVNAGTVEFLVDAQRNPYFLEMNTRLQVEHPVTEMVTGVDLVKLQIRIAQGEPLPLRQEDLAQRGHAIECRVYAEDPDAGFLPSPGRIVALRPPGGPGVRDDSGIDAGGEVPIDYDPLVSKLIVWAPTRDEAIQRMRRAVSEYRVLGIKTTLPLFERLLAHPDFGAGDFDTSFIDTVLATGNGRGARTVEIAVAAAAIRAFEERRATRAQPGTARTDLPAWRAASLREAHGARLGEPS